MSYFRIINDWERVGLILITIGMVLLVLRFMYDDAGLAWAHRLVQWSGILIFWFGIYTNFRNRHEASKAYEDERPKRG